MNVVKGARGNESGRSEAQPKIGGRWLVPCLRGRELLERQGRSDGGDGGSIDFFLLQSKWRVE